MIIDIDGIPIEVVKKSIKNMHLRIYPDGVVKVSAPLYSCDQLIRQQVEKKIDWIRTQRESMRARVTEQEDCWQTGSRVTFKGRQYSVIMTEHDGPAHINTQDRWLFWFMPMRASQKQKQAFLEQWYRREMQAVIPELLTRWQRIIPVRVSEWGIKKMKTRWGTCNTRAKRIWLNSNLIKKPPICLEYVLVHELIHLLEPSHNKRFYSLMTEYMPQWREYQCLLEGKTAAESCCEK